MEEELFKLLEEYIEESKENKKLHVGNKIILSDDFLEKLYKLYAIIARYTNRKYLKGVSVYESGYQTRDDLAVYCFEEKEIKIFHQPILESISNMLKYSNFSKEMWYKMLYDKIIHSSLHEREHIQQFELMFSFFNQTFEKELLRYTNIFYDDEIINLAKKSLRQEKKKVNDCTMNGKMEELYELVGGIYHECYDMLPIERLAEIRTYEKMMNIYGGHIGYEFFYSISEMSLKKSFLKGYKLSKDIVQSPTIVVLEKISSEVKHDVIPFSWYSDDKKECLDNVLNQFSFEDRLLYGLPITPDEYNNQEKELKKFEKKLGKFYGIRYK